VVMMMTDFLSLY